MKKKTARRHGKTLLDQDWQIQRECTRKSFLIRRRYDSQVYLSFSRIRRSIERCRLYFFGLNSRDRSIFNDHYGTYVRCRNLTRCIFALNFRYTLTSVLFVCLFAKGEPIELRYIISGYGIPADSLPISNTGNVKTVAHSRLIYALLKKMSKEQDDEEVIVEFPRSRDVVFRKGPTYKNNPGNMYYRELIERTNCQHSTAKRKEKVKVVFWNGRIQEQCG